MNPADRPYPARPSHPPRADHWQLRTRSLPFGPLPAVMGILNVTPDSFSDGGRYLEAAAAVDRGLAMAAAGATILDVGGESTRPYAEPVDVDEELRRVIPVVAALCEQAAVPVSIDTSKPRVAREALRAGAEIVNDVTAARDPAMVAAALDFSAAVCVMHMQGEPRTMQVNPEYGDVVGEVAAFLARRCQALRAGGVAAGRIAVDPGIGFGKRLEHNLALLRAAGRLHELGHPLVVGHSRKRFIGEVLGRPEADRTAGTVGVALALARRGVQVLRVHDVAEVCQAFTLFEAAGGLELEEEGR